MPHIQLDSGHSELARHLGVPEDELREARQAHLVFTTHSLDVPLAHGDDPALLSDILGEDDLALSHPTDIDAVYAYLADVRFRRVGSTVDLLVVLMVGVALGEPRYFVDPLADLLRVLLGVGLRLLLQVVPLAHAILLCLTDAGRWICCPLLFLRAAS